jgi:hypothetical protein
MSTHILKTDLLRQFLLIGNALKLAAQRFASCYGWSVLSVYEDKLESIKNGCLEKLSDIIEISEIMSGNAGKNALNAMTDHIKVCASRHQKLERR